MATDLPKIEDADLRGKKVLMRADLNVTFRPGTTEIADDSRIHATMDSVKLLRSKKAKVILCSHLGRPKGRVVPEMRIEPVRRRLSQVLEAEVKYAGGPVGDEAKRVVNDLDEGDVAILENLRFDPGEEANDPDFAKGLSSLAEVLVNDAFGASHRSHASIVGVAAMLPTYAGLLMRDEIVALERAMQSDERPAIAVLGGAKVADKLGVVHHLSPNVDAILIGGGMVSALLAAQGKQTGSVKIAEDELSAASQLLEDAAVAEKLRLPSDVIVADEFSENSAAKETSVDEVSDRGYILDIGPSAVSEYIGLLESARKIIWNGPVGLFEWETFASGTAAIGKAIATNPSAFKLAGGGSTVEAINALGIADHISHVSTGGGASLEYLEGKTLPGIAALRSS